MNDSKVAMARLVFEQLNRKDRVALIKEFGPNDVTQEQAKAAVDLRILRRIEVAQRLSVSLRTVDNWAREGLLSKKRLPGRKLACGFSSQELDKLITQGFV
jgi:hypothetical protein